MNAILKVKLNRDDDGSAGIVATVKTGAFSGTGEAWFNITDINKFIIKLENFAKTTEDPPFIEGGNWDEQGNLKLSLLSLRFYMFSTHRYGVQVNLADYPYTNCREEEISRVIAELKPEAQSIVEFTNQLKQLVNSEIEEAILECH